MFSIGEVQVLIGPYKIVGQFYGVQQPTHIQYMNRLLQTFPGYLQPLFETKDLALHSASGYVHLSEALNAYAKHTQLSKHPRGQASLSRVWSRSRGYEKGHYCNLSLCIGLYTALFGQILFCPLCFQKVKYVFKNKVIIIIATRMKTQTNNVQMKHSALFVS